jgi:parvulin-like peptidyl-prolyl isomerase
MQAGEVSGVLESELGFHILSCDAITEANVLTINEARPHIRSVLEKKRKRAFQQEWLKNLRVAKTAG